MQNLAKMRQFFSSEIQSYESKTTAVPGKTDGELLYRFAKKNKRSQKSLGKIHKKTDLNYGKKASINYNWV